MPRRQLGRGVEFGLVGETPPPHPRQPTSQSHFLDALKALQPSGSGAPLRSAMNLRPGVCEGICSAQESRGRAGQRAFPVLSLRACISCPSLDLHRATLKLTQKRDTMTLLHVVRLHLVWPSDTARCP